MAKTETHKQAAATLRRMAARIDTLTTAEAAQLARMVESVFTTSTAIQGEGKRLKEGKRGRKPQDNKTLADIATAAAPAELAEMVSRWAQNIVKSRWTARTTILAALALALVELGYISGTCQKAIYNALLDAIPLPIQHKFGKSKSFSNAYRQLSNPKIFPDKAGDYREYIERLKAYLKAP